MIKEFSFLYLIVFFLLTSCTSTVSHTKLFKGVKSIRTNVNIKLIFSDKINQRCRDEVMILTKVEPSSLVYYKACSIIQPDSALTKNKSSICTIILPKANWHEPLQHEILHCLGYAHD